MTPLTLKEDSDRRFAIWQKTDQDRWTFGTKPLVTWGPIVNPYDWLISAGCNLFHADDVATALLSRYVPFSVVFVRKQEREHECIVAMHPSPTTTHHVRVQASGYGLGEALYFSRRCPPRLQFQLCRALALEHTRMMIEHYDFSVTHPGPKKRGALHRRVLANEHWALAELQAFQDAIWKTVRTYDDLVRVTTQFNRRAARRWKRIK